MTRSLALATLTFALAAATSCIIPDSGIRIYSQGFEWCANAEGAMGKNSESNPAEPILDAEGKIAQGCACVSSGGHALLEKWAAQGGPPDGHADRVPYVLLRDEILGAARAACHSAATAAGYTSNNCIEVIHDEDDLVRKPGMSDNYDCKFYGEDPYAGTGGETDGGETPIDTASLRCSGRNCTASRALVNALFDHPERFLEDSARIAVRKNGLAFEDVQPGDLLHRVGIRSGDQLLEINGKQARQLDQAVDALFNLRNASLATLKVRDTAGRVVTFSLRVQ